MLNPRAFSGHWNGSPHVLESCGGRNVRRKGKPICQKSKIQQLPCGNPPLAEPAAAEEPEGAHSR